MSRPDGSACRAADTPPRALFACVAAWRRHPAPTHARSISRSMPRGDETELRVHADAAGAPRGVVCARSHAPEREVERTLRLNIRSAWKSTSCNLDAGVAAAFTGRYRARSSRCAERGAERWTARAPVTVRHCISPARAAAADEFGPHPGSRDRESAARPSPDSDSPDARSRASRARAVHAFRECGGCSAARAAATR